jgi:hypothetical protein
MPTVIASVGPFVCTAASTEPKLPISGNIGAWDKKPSLKGGVTFEADDSLTQF